MCYTVLVKKEKIVTGKKSFAAATEMEFRREVLESLELIEAKLGVRYTPSIKELKKRFLVTGEQTTTRESKCQHSFYMTGEVLMKNGMANISRKCSRCGEERDDKVDAAPY